MKNSADEVKLEVGEKEERIVKKKKFFLLNKNCFKTFFFLNVIELYPR